MATDDDDISNFAANSGFSKMEQNMGPESYANLLKFQEAQLDILHKNAEQVDAVTAGQLASNALTKAHTEKQERITNAIALYALFCLPALLFVLAGVGLWVWGVALG